MPPNVCVCQQTILRVTKAQTCLWTSCNRARIISPATTRRDGSTQTSIAVAHSAREHLGIVAIDLSVGANCVKVDATGMPHQHIPMLAAKLQAPWAPYIARPIGYHRHRSGSNPPWHRWSPAGPRSTRGQASNVDAIWASRASTSGNLATCEIPFPQPCP